MHFESHGILPCRRRRRATPWTTTGAHASLCFVCSGSCTFMLYGACIPSNLLNATLHDQISSFACHVGSAYWSFSLKYLIPSPVTVQPIRWSRCSRKGGTSSSANVFRDDLDRALVSFVLVWCAARTTLTQTNAGCTRTEWLYISGAWVLPHQLSAPTALSASPR